MKYPFITIYKKLPARRPEHHGFTLMETLIALAVGLLILLAIFTLFFTFRNAFVSLTNRTELTQNNRIILERATRDIRQAVAIATRLPASEIELQDGHDTSTLTYLRYYRADSTLNRETSYYSFPAAPEIRVHFDELDAQGNRPTKTVLSSELVAEYVTTFSVSAPQDRLITLTITSASHTTIVPAITTIFARNVP